MPLDIHVQGFDIANFESRMQAMARPAYSALVSHATDARPAIVFVPTRKHARLTAMDLLAFAAADGLPTRFLQVNDQGVMPGLGMAYECGRHTSIFDCRAFCFSTSSIPKD